MLFLAKRKAKSGLVSALLLGAGAVLAHGVLGLTWSLSASGWRAAADGLFMLAVLLASDASLHTLLSKIAPSRYPPAFLALAERFSQQMPLDWSVGAASAGAEELFFRGALLPGAIKVLGLDPVSAAALVAIAFGLAHLILNRQLWAFSIWAAWEGFLLGLVYLVSGSLVAVVGAHVAHDALGFWLFRRSLGRATV
jgi:membrane protease YdiL (CAAX protease family)